MDRGCRESSSRPACAPGVSHELFDHTSIIKTCLARFCRQEGRLIPDMGARVNAANHLGILLEKEVQVARPGDAALDGLAAGVRRWRAESCRRRSPHRATPCRRIPLLSRKDYIAAREAVLGSMTQSERARAAKALGM